MKLTTTTTTEIGTDGIEYRHVTNHTGERFGRLTVTGFSHRYGGKSYYTCKCDCGMVVPVMYSHLLAGHTTSCGCYRNEGCRKRMRANRTRRIELLGLPTDFDVKAKAGQFAAHDRFGDADSFIKGAEYMRMKANKLFSERRCANCQNRMDGTTEVVGCLIKGSMIDDDMCCPKWERRTTA